MAHDLWLLPLTSLPTADKTLERVRGGGYDKAVALVGYRDDAEANDVSRCLPYGNRGEGIEEIVFLRVEPTGADLTFEDDAWPGEDRTWVTEDLAVALRLLREFADEHGPDGALVIVVGDETLHSGVTTYLS